ncbi:hypothetical protein evm_003031 [Chilo suppressalis]|nr:hypothetical protein evm_003031 [Chilo suppressalis]
MLESTNVIPNHTYGKIPGPISLFIVVALSRSTKNILLNRCLNINQSGKMIAIGSSCTFQSHNGAMLGLIQDMSIAEGLWLMVPTVVGDPVFSMQRSHSSNKLYISLPLEFDERQPNAT